MLVVRSCRAAQFAAAVQLARSRTPGARVVGLTVKGHREAVLACGVDEVLEIPGRSFNLLRTSPWMIRRLRLRRFEEIVIPQMTRDVGRHLNVYGLVAACSADRFVVIPGEHPPRVLDRPGLSELLRQALLEWFAYRWDSAIFVVLVVASCMRRRMPVSAAPGRRRVLHIIGSLGTGGAQVQLAELLNRIPASEYDVGLLVLDTSDGFSSRSLITRDDLQVTFLTRWPNRTLSVQEIVAHCREGQYGLVHTWILGSNVIGFAAARLAGVPRVITSVRGMSKSHKWWFREWWWRLLDVLTSRAADIVTVNAHALVDDHARWAHIAPSRIQVVQNGLDPASLPFDRVSARASLLEVIGAPVDAVVIGTSGRLSHEKDQSTFLRMLSQVRTSRPDVYGVIVGDGRSRASLEQLAGSLGLAHAVTFLGERSDARVLMAGFDLFVLPSIVEGFPNVLLEAAFLGVPCVATRVGGNAEVMGPEAALFTPGDIDECARVVLRMLSDRVGTTGHARLVRSRALELFTSERSVGTWMNLYRQCFSTRADAAAFQSALPEVPAVDVTRTR